MSVFTEFGTRFLFLEGGDAIGIEKDEKEKTTLTVKAGAQKTAVRLNQSEVLSLIEYLAIAAKTGTGVPLVNATAEQIKEIEKG